jgi:DNA-binding response OmpR family regulator
VDPRAPLARLARDALSHTAVLLIEDDAKLAALVREYLGRHEMEVRVVPDGERGLAALRHGGIEVVLLDVMLPGSDGFEVCRRIRATRECAGVPVLMLTARSEDVDKVVGLELGADDYVTKPFNPRELVARIRAVLRRGASGHAATRFRTGQLEIDFDAREVAVGGCRVLLTHHEFEVLAALARAAGRVLSREQVMDAVRGGAGDAFDRSIDVHISKLRAKIETNPRAPRYLKTVRGTGYTLVRHERVP